jgi:hypothetical protein
MEANLVTVYQVLFNVRYANGHNCVVTITQPAATGREAAAMAEQFIKTNWQNLSFVQLKHWHIRPATGIFARQMQ